MFRASRTVIYRVPKNVSKPTGGTGNSRERSQLTVLWSLGAEAYLLRETFELNVGNVTAGTRFEVVAIRRTDKGTIRDERGSLENPNLEAIAQAVIRGLQWFKSKCRMAEFRPFRPQR